MVFFRTIVATTLAVASLANALSLGHTHHARSQSHKHQCRNTTNTPPIQPGSNQKVGIVYTADSASFIQTLKNSHTKYFYTWRPDVPLAAKQAGFTSCSTMWGTKSIAKFRQVRDQYSCVIGMNEVNLDSQANLEPGPAASLWDSEVGFLAAKGTLLVGPSVTTAPNGMSWMQQFFKLCSKSNGPTCGITYLNLHYYGTSSTDFITYMTKFYNQFGLPIMVTEFACTDFSGKVHPSPDQVRQWTADVVKWMESTSWIIAYFAFGLTDGSLWGVTENARLLAGATSLNSLGNAYINVNW